MTFNVQLLCSCLTCPHSLYHAYAIVYRPVRFSVFLRPQVNSCKCVCACAVRLCPCRGYIHCGCKLVLLWTDKLCQQASLTCDTQGNRDTQSVLAEKGTHGVHRIRGIHRVNRVLRGCKGYKRSTGYTGYSEGTQCIQGIQVIQITKGTDGTLGTKSTRLPWGRVHEL